MAHWKALDVIQRHALVVRLWGLQLPGRRPVVKAPRVVDHDQPVLQAGDTIEVRVDRNQTASPLVSAANPEIRNFFR